MWLRVADETHPKLFAIALEVGFAWNVESVWNHDTHGGDAIKLQVQVGVEDLRSKSVLLATEYRESNVQSIDVVEYMVMRQCKRAFTHHLEMNHDIKADSGATQLLAAGEVVAHLCCWQLAAAARRIQTPVVDEHNPIRAGRHLE